MTEKSWLYPIVFCVVSLVLPTVRPAEMQETCVERCLKLVTPSSSVKVANDSCGTLVNEPDLIDAKINCNRHCGCIVATVCNKTGNCSFQTSLPVPSSPSFISSEFNAITLQWNNSEKASSRVSVYVLQVKSNRTSQGPLEILPFVSKYHFINATNNIPSTTFTLKDLPLETEYRFRVAAFGPHGVSDYSDWSAWFPTNSTCERSTANITFFTFTGRTQTQTVNFPCPIRQLKLNVSLKIVEKNPVVLDATLSFKHPPDLTELKKSNGNVKITVKLLKHEDSNVQDVCDHYHDYNFEKEYSISNVGKIPEYFHLFSDIKDGAPKSSIHFGCKYQVKVEGHFAFALGNIPGNSFETTTVFQIPECLQGVRSCPIPNHNSQRKSDIQSRHIDIKISEDFSGNYTTRITWNNEVWKNGLKVQFFHTTVEDWSPRKRYYFDNNTVVLDRVSNYSIVVRNMTEGKTYRVVIRAYHGKNCIRDRIERETFEIIKPCKGGCNPNATCLPKNTFDGTAQCKCNAGFYRNGTICTVIKHCNDGCDRNATCLPRNIFDGSARCKCNEGFSGNGTFCAVIKPCKGGCNPNATCLPKNTFDGTAQCKCNAGFYRNGTICTVIKHCNDGCDRNATCLPRNIFDGSARCKCNEGFSGNGTFCAGIKVAIAQTTNNPKEGINAIAVVVPVVLILALLLCVGVFLWKRRQKGKRMARELFIEMQNAGNIPNSSSNSNLYRYLPSTRRRSRNTLSTEDREVNLIYVPQEIQDAISSGLTDGYEFNAELLKIGDRLGKGAFGDVYYADAQAINTDPGLTPVAVKTLNEHTSERYVDSFLEEIQLMKRLGDHENVIKMLGCCTLSLPICLILEYAPHGNLLDYLRVLRSKFEVNIPIKKHAEDVDDLQKKTSSLEQFEKSSGKTSPEIKSAPEEEKSLGKELPVTDFRDIDVVIESHELESFALQIAKGMAYVTEIGIVHRDLAARNILIGHDRVLKISDFGLSKEGVYVKTTSGKIPLRWLSTEAIRERLYSSASDVWSFGIILWEICTLGGFPYPTISDRDLLQYLEKGNRMRKPSNCTNEIYTIMLDCWSQLPADRPPFGRLSDLLWKLNNNENPYVNIDALQDLPPVRDEGSFEHNSEGSVTSDEINVPSFDPESSENRKIAESSEDGIEIKEERVGTPNPGYRPFDVSVDPEDDSGSEKDKDTASKKELKDNAQIDFV